MIIELAGLPGAGKTTRAHELSREHGLQVVLAPMHVVPLVIEGLAGALGRPMAAFALLRLMMREPNKDIRHSLFVNGWLGSSAKYWRARHGGIIDQGYVQALIGALPHSSDARLVARVLAGVRKNVQVVWCDEAQAAREERLAKRPYRPRGEFSEREAERFIKESERAYQEIRQIAERPSTGLLHRAFKFSGYMFASVMSWPASIDRTEAVVLMYHAIDRSGWKLSVAPELFERQMHYLARKGWAVPLTDVVAYAKGEKKLPAHAVAVTFDDGYRDLLTTVFPILERYRIPATIFIPSDLSAPTDPSSTARLTEEELRALAQSPLITIGSHAKTHRKFTELSPEEMKNESKDSADALTRIAGTRPHFFSYPFGARSSDAERAVKDAGYNAAFGITEGTIRPNDDLFRLKRVQIDGTMSFLLFRLRLTAAVDWNRRIVGLVRA